MDMSKQIDEVATKPDAYEAEQEFKMKNSFKTALKASELVEVLKKRINEFGDLEIVVNTQEGAGYSLYGAEDVSLRIGTAKDGSIMEWLEIG